MSTLAIFQSSTRYSIKYGCVNSRALSGICNNLVSKRSSSNLVEVDHFASGWKLSDEGYEGPIGKFQIKTFNKISTKGLNNFTQKDYEILSSENESNKAHVIMMRSHKLQESEVDITVRAIARCGAGTNNIPVSRMTELGIPVFNTPGANSNAVKELILCSLLLGSRRICEGVNHMKELGKQGLAKERVEKDKSKFGGQEINGKTLAVIGLGHIGASSARDAASLGMKIVGYDPKISIESALKLPRSIKLTDSISDAVSTADYISLNIPYIKGDNGTHGIIGPEVISKFKNNAVLLNFARGELVDSDAMKEFLDSSSGKYITDFPDDILWDHKNVTVLPHLGASTGEAEDSAAKMASDTLINYLETGTIRNSVNFPSTSLPDINDAIRISVVNNNVPGVLAKIVDSFGKSGLNIIQQVNHSRGNIAYNVIDIDPVNNFGDDKPVILRELQKEITMHEGVLSTRVLYGVRGTGYARNINNEYYV